MSPWYVNQTMGEAGTRQSVAEDKKGIERIRRLYLYAMRC